MHFRRNGKAKQAKRTDMKIGDLLLILQSAPDKEKQVWMPAFDGERTTYIDFNFDDENNLDLYEVVKEVESYTLQKISKLDKTQKLKLSLNKIIRLIDIFNVILLLIKTQQLNFSPYPIHSNFTPQKSLQIGIDSYCNKP